MIESDRTDRVPQDPCTPALLTDLYQLTMMQSYLESGMTGPATFELLVRALPANRGFLLAAGLAEALDVLQRVRFSKEEIRWLRTLKLFRDDFLDYLRGFRFTGDVWAVEEGTPVFSAEILLRIDAPLIEAQFFETVLLNTIHYSTLVAGKAARCVLAAPQARLLEFGLRRAPGKDAAVKAARSSYLAGFVGTSNVQAGRVHDIPVYGTMAHSYVLAHEDEKRAFLDFARMFPDNAVLLIDTYDTLEGVRKVVEVARRLAAEGISIRGVRLDSGDIGTLSRQVRRILDEAGLTETAIFASGNLDEYRLAAFRERDLPIGGYGIGTRLVTTADAPSMECAYKLVEYEGRPVRKLSTGKKTLPGKKQIYRQRTAERPVLDRIVPADETGVPGEPLLRKVMEAGRILGDRPSLAAVRRNALQQLHDLPGEYRSLEGPYPIPVEISPRLFEDD